jgi:thiol-disulfide isomerase/thioredoxin
MGKFTGQLWPLLVLALAAGCSPYWQGGWPFSTTSLSKKAEDNPSAPDGTDADGKPLRLSDYRGKVVLLSFWKTACPPCRAMFPHEKQLVVNFRNAPFALIGVNEDNAPEQLKRTQMRAGLTWPSFWDGPGGPLCRDWKVNRLPTFILLDTVGQECWRCEGMPAEGELDARIAQLLAEPPAR